MPPTRVSPAGLDHPSGAMSLSSTVPAAVPSLLYSSRPRLLSWAVKNSVAPTSVMSIGVDPAGPVFTSASNVAEASSARRSSGSGTNGARERRQRRPPRVPARPGKFGNIMLMRQT